jgi:hypothetical protein
MRTSRPRGERRRRESSLPTKRRFGPGALLTLALMLGLTSAALAGQERRQTYEEKMLNRLHTICDDRTRGVSRYHKILYRWESTITTPGKSAQCQVLLAPDHKTATLRCP